MEFDFFSLWFVYYPVSGILWVWHKVFGAAFGADNGFAWALSVIFMTFTVRLVLLKPFIHQMRSMRKMQEFQPQIKKLQEKYKNDKQKLSEEMQKLQREHGVNPIGGCLPVLVQLPVFIGLYHVLRGFRLDYAYNYVFSHTEIESFLRGDIFGVTLDQAIHGSLQTIGGLNFFNGPFNSHVMPVAIPLMIVSAVATHFTARVSRQNQSPASAANPQAAIMGKLTMWVFPLGVLVFGALLPVAILLYWLSNNSWTLAQQYLVYKKISREEEEKRELAREQRDSLAPRPGQKPGQRRDEAGAVGDGAAVAVVEADAAPVDGDAPTDGSADGRGAGAKRSPGKVGGGAGAAKASTSGRSSPGKVGGPNGGNQGAQGGGNGSKNGAGNGSKNNGSKNNGGKGKGGGKNGQLASSGQPGKRSKKRR